MLKAVKQKVEEPGLTFCLKKVFLDHESAALKAFQQIFPDTNLKGCDFHFNQCLIKKVPEFGLMKANRGNSSVRKCIQLIAALAHVPLERMNDGWLVAMEECPLTEYPRLEKYNDYLIHTRLENIPMPRSL